MSLGLLNGVFFFSGVTLFLNHGKFIGEPKKNTESFQHQNLGHLLRRHRRHNRRTHIRIKLNAPYFCHRLKMLNNSLCERLCALIFQLGNYVRNFNIMSVFQTKLCYCLVTCNLQKKKKMNEK